MSLVTCDYAIFLFSFSVGDPEIVKKDHHYYFLTPKKSKEQGDQQGRSHSTQEPHQQYQRNQEPVTIEIQPAEVTCKTEPAVPEPTLQVKLPSDSSDSESSSYSDRSSDEDYTPEEEESSDDDEPEPPKDIPEAVVEARKFVIFEEQLFELLRYSKCRFCKKVLLIEDDIEKNISIQGTAVTFKACCIDGHIHEWNSQPTLGTGNQMMFAGNLLVSAAVLFSGCNFAKIQHFANILNMAFIARKTFDNHQNTYLFPTIHATWDRERESLWHDIRVRGGVRLSGDGRCDSPGYSAKYCTYSVMDMDTNKVVDTETVNVKEVSSSNAMEKEALKRVLERMEHEMIIDVLCTDRHLGIQAMMKSEFDYIQHQFDVWHLSKSVAKKLVAKAKKKEAEELMSWVPAIKNHLWWSASTCNGDEVTLVEKWQSVSKHVTDNHDWGHGQRYQQCAHDEFTEEEREAIKWIEAESPAHVELNKVLFDKRLLDGIQKLSLFCHTGNLENFNGFMTKYCPKRNAFSHEGMVARSRLAALDHNFNVGRDQAVVREESRRSAPAGTKRYNITYSKATKKWTAKKVMDKKQYDFIDDMLVEVVERKLQQDTSSSFQPPELPSSIAPASVPKPSKEEAIAAHLSRFGQ